MVPTVLSIAGSDSGGGAGIQADLKTFADFGTYGTSVITAVTAQNTRGVHDIHAVPATSVRAQLRAVLSDLDVAATKTGMLGTEELLRLVADALEEGSHGPLVVDPVLMSTTGQRLASNDLLSAFRTRLLPIAHVVTPNLHEAAMLTESSVDDVRDMRAAARALVRFGATAALVTGGHLTDRACDVLQIGADTYELELPRVPGPSVHGTGCTLSAAIAARLALGDSLVHAVADAKRHVTAALRAPHTPGHGVAVLHRRAKMADTVEVVIRSS